MDRQKYNGKIVFLEKLISPFGKFGYFIIGTFSAIIGGYFILVAVNHNNLINVIIPLFFMFIVGYCWNKDSERATNEKD